MRKKPRKLFDHALDFNLWSGRRGRIRLHTHGLSYGFGMFYLHFGNDDRSLVIRMWNIILMVSLYKRGLL